MTQSNQPDSFPALKEFDDISVRADTIQAYMDYLLEELDLPCEVVTSAEFERYQLTDLEDSNDELFGLLGNVKQMTEEEKQSLIPLCDLREVDNRSKNFKILKDYATWFINNQ